MNIIMPFQEDMMTIWILCLVAMILPAQGSTRIEDPEHQPAYVQEGTQLQFGCRQTDCYSVIWRQGSKTITGDGTDGFVSTEWDLGSCEVYAQLVKNEVDRADAGIYSCVPDGDSNSYHTMLIVFSIDGEDAVLSESGGESVRLGCRVSSEVSRDPSRSPMIWLRHGRPLTIDNRKYVVNPRDDSHLTINNARESDIGEYTCAFELPNGLEYSQAVHLRAGESEQLVRHLADMRESRWRRHLADLREARGRFM